MIDRSHSLPVTWQVRALGISRGSVYYRPRPASDADLALMRRIDQLHLEHPIGFPQNASILWGPDRRKQDGARHAAAGRRLLRTQARSDPDEAHGHRGAVPEADHEPQTPGSCRPSLPAAWAGRDPAEPGVDHGHHGTPQNACILREPVTYIPMARGFVYLAAVMDWHSRRVLAWRVSISMDPLALPPRREAAPVTGPIGGFLRSHGHLLQRASCPNQVSKETLAREMTESGNRLDDGLFARVRLRCFRAAHAGFRNAARSVA